jgi:hypothetical protein
MTDLCPAKPLNNSSLPQRIYFMENIIADPSTTIRNYSLFAEACDREQKALEDWMRAGFENEMEPTTTSAVRLIRAEKKLKDAIRDRRAVVKEVFSDAPSPVDAVQARRAYIEASLRDPFITQQTALALLDELAELEVYLSKE